MLHLLKNLFSSGASAHASQRLDDRLLAYWESLRNGRAYPEESDINPEMLRDIWDHCFLAESKAGGFYYDFLGQHLIELYGASGAGAEIGEQLVDPAHMRLREGLVQAQAAGVPVRQAEEFKSANGLTIRYRALLLPLGSGGKVRFILGGVRWRAY